VRAQNGFESPHVSGWALKEKQDLNNFTYSKFQKLAPVNLSNDAAIEINSTKRVWVRCQDQSEMLRQHQ
jgi:hypothetical protein